MPVIQPLYETRLPLPGRRQGKVRDVYALPGSAGRHQGGEPDEAEQLLLVASDRISAFDVVMPTPVPGKGVALTQIACFWFAMMQERLEGRLQHHLLHQDSSQIQSLSAEDQQRIAGRSMVCQPARVIPIECVARGYLAGSGWKSYRESGSICGIDLPEGLPESGRLPEPIFTPATKADEGHDENISFARAKDLVGDSIMDRLRDWSLKLYQIGHDHCRERGIILADTKFEFGLDSDGRLMLVDEILTPDSSRLWPAESYEPGSDQPSFDKQFVRNYLEDLCEKGAWDKTPPGPELPTPIVDQTLERYREACRRITGAEPTF